MSHCSWGEPYHKTFGNFRGPLLMCVKAVFGCSRQVSQFRKFLTSACAPKFLGRHMHRYTPTPTPSPSPVYLSGKSLSSWSVECPCCRAELTKQGGCGVKPKIGTQTTGWDHHLGPSWDPDHYLGPIPSLSSDRRDLNQIYVRNADSLQFSSKIKFYAKIISDKVFAALLCSPLNMSCLS